MFAARPVRCELEWVAKLATRETGGQKRLSCQRELLRLASTIVAGGGEFCQSLDLPSVPCAPHGIGPSPLRDLAFGLRDLFECHSFRMICYPVLSLLISAGRPIHAVTDGLTPLLREFDTPCLIPERGNASDPWPHWSGFEP